MRFESPWALLLLLAIPLLLLVSARLRGWRGSLRFSSTAHVRQLGRSWRQRLAWLPQGLRIMALVLLVGALARPQQGVEEMVDVGKGVAIEMVVDRSSSMGQEMHFGGQSRPRLDVVKEVFNDFVMGDDDLPGRPNDLIGMVAFARYADTVCPLTLSQGAVSELLKSVKLVKRRNEDGTAIGDAIALAAARLRTAEETLAQQTDKQRQDFEIKSKVIVLLTDGRNNRGERTPAEAAALAEKWGIKIYAIGVGGQEGVMRQQGLMGSFLIRRGGGVDEATLKMLAQKTGGKYFLAEDEDSLREIYAEIDALERSEIESVRYLEYEELFVWLAVAAMVLLALEVGLGATVFRKLP